MKTLTCFVLFLPILTLAAVESSEISRTDALGNTWTAAPYLRGDTHVGFLVQQFDPAGLPIWKNMFDPGSADHLTAELDLSHPNMVILTLRNAEGRGVCAVAYNHWGAMLWVRNRTDNVTPSALRDPEQPQSNRFPYQPGWPVIGQTIEFFISQSLTSADIDLSDPQLEVVVPFWGGILQYDHAGILVPGWPVFVESVRGASVIQQNDMGKVCFGDNPWGSQSAFLYVCQPNGVPDPGWPLDVPHMDVPPIRIDLNNNGNPDILENGDALVNLHSGLVALNSDGFPLPGYPVLLPQNASGIAVGDVNNDGQPEIVCSSTTLINKVMAVFSATGQVLARWRPITTESGGSQNFPSLADLDDDGDLEIIMPFLKDLVVYHHDGTPFWGYRFPDFPLGTSPAVADLDGDGRLEVIVVSNFDSLYVFSSDGAIRPGWPVKYRQTAWGVFTAVQNSSAAVGDIDGDGEEEIVVNAYSSYHQSTEHWAILALNPDGSIADGFPCWEPASYCPLGTPIITDLDMNGDVEIIAYAMEPGPDPPFRIVAYDLPYAYNPGRTDWPMFCHDPQRTGCFNTPLPDRVSASATPGSESLGAMPSKFIQSCSPNPFNATTVASYELRVASHVSLRVYNTAGRLARTLVDGWRLAGKHQAVFDGSDLPSGIYLARLTAGEFQQTQKLVLMK